MKSLKKTILRSEDLSCPSCVSNIESTLNNMEGVHEAEVHFNTGRIEVEHDNEAVSEQNLIDAIQDTGYQAKVSNF